MMDCKARMIDISLYVKYHPDNFGAVPKISGNSQGSI